MIQILTDVLSNTAQIATIVVLGGAVKLYCDVQKLKRDMNKSFRKIRVINNKLDIKE